MQVRDSSGALRTVTGIQVRDADGLLRSVQNLQMRDNAGVLRSIPAVGGLAVSLTPSFVSGYSYSVGAPRGSTSPPATIAVTGGTAPYTVVWTLEESGWVEITPNALVTQFRGPGTPPASSDSTTLYATVTDANGLTGVTNTIEANITNEHAEP